MSCFSFSSILCIVVLSLNPSCHAFMSWFGGGSAASENPGGTANPSVMSYPEESGECSHWGNAALPFPSQDPMSPQYGLPLPGNLIGSHRRIPVGSVVAVTNMKNGNTVRVRIVPPKTIPILGRVMDLSPAAFSQVESINEGVFACSVKILNSARTDPNSLSAYTFDNGQRTSLNIPSMPSVTQEHSEIIPGRSTIVNPY